MSFRVEIDSEGTPYVDLGKYQFKLDLEEITDEYKERAIAELQEHPERVTEGLEKLRELIEAENGLNLPLDDEKFLTKFLRPFRFNPDRAFKILRKFYKFKAKHPKYAGRNVTPHEVRHVFDSEVFLMLPTRTKMGGRILVVNCGTIWNPKEVKLEDMFKAIMVAIEIAMLEPKTQVGGVNVVLNMEGLSLHHIYQFSPTMAKLIIDWVQECAPVRLRGLHVVNQSYIFNILYGIFKPFIGDYLKKRITFHGQDYVSMTDVIGIEGLPERFGGKAELPDYPSSIFADMLFYYEEDFKVYNSYGYIIEDKMDKNDKKKLKQEKTLPDEHMVKG